MLHKYYAQLECEPGVRWTPCAACCNGPGASSIPEYFAGLVHACRYAGLLEASVAAHEEARRLDPTIPTSITNTLLMSGNTSVWCG